MSNLENVQFWRRKKSLVANNYFIFAKMIVKSLGYKNKVLKVCKTLNPKFLHQKYCHQTILRKQNKKKFWLKNADSLENLAHIFSKAWAVNNSFSFTRTHALFLTTFHFVLRLRNWQKRRLYFHHHR